MLWVILSDSYGKGTEYAAGCRFPKAEIHFGPFKVFLLTFKEYLLDNHVTSSATRSLELWPYIWFHGQFIGLHDCSFGSILFNDFLTRGRSLPRSRYSNTLRNHACRHLFRIFSIVCAAIFWGPIAVVAKSEHSKIFRAIVCRFKYPKNYLHEYLQVAILITVGTPRYGLRSRWSQKVSRN